MPEPSRPVVLLFPGQGAQHPGMAVELYGAEPEFTAAMDEFFALMGEEGGRLRADWLGDDPQVPLDDASRAQPLLFAIGYALGTALLARGVRPAALLGHSVGELAAACLAGVFDLAGAARLMAARSRAMATTGAGGMLAAGVAADDLEPRIGAPYRAAGVAVAAINGPRNTVVAGPEPWLSELAGELAAGGVTTRRVPSRQAFHCPAVLGAAELFAAGFAGVPLAPPRVPIRSTATGLPVTRAQALSPGFWAGQLARPVLFWAALDGLLADGDYTLVEAGPGRSLSMPARRHAAVRSGRSTVLAPLPAPGNGVADGTLAGWKAAMEEMDVLVGEGV
ncbi:acyltransferase domain-containing protein [Nonomuraea diastatica]|uniref:Acyltransferase domain-containing protein n=1 Tax=Nonomuraea diastatica TaxID=1848329 RepID=A0A4R4W0T3_9ACTN|nr:acyltransferase domain-containing protein [Nonomuraea diastatica]TDD08505.1 acyltransferase domain-containing protein [Nonomuraea diastatica]